MLDVDERTYERWQKSISSEPAQDTKTGHKQSEDIK
jgi:hypothetical protein